MAATIHDVARLAGCSIKSVSRVINNEPYVTEELRARVQNAIRVSGYAPNISARRLATQKSFMVCILMYPGFYQPASAILTRVMDITIEEDYDILIRPYFPGNRVSRNRLNDMIAERRIDGFVSTPPCDADGFIADLLSTYKVPLVQINPINPAESIPSVSGNDYQGAYATTEHLISIGHQRIAFLMGPRNMRSSFDRLYGYRAALDAHQLIQDPALVENSEFTFDGGYTATRLLMERAEKPTAIFAGNDEAAYGAIYALQELRVPVPERISVCGYDDLALSKNIWPGLTTVHQPAEEMVELAARMLIRILKKEPLDDLHQVVASRLIQRGSTAPAPHQ
ncbi:MAG TPA: LacI family DNA-binding transcriptional regulator [Anaerolineaceae bacterium]|nr:LacI family DNA-binding transcriptional regulator [Anaerolineaceae bacterium]